MNTKPKERSLFERVIFGESDAADAKPTIESVRNIGAISNVFADAGMTMYEIYTEATGLRSIRKVTHEDVTSDYFIDWFFEIMKTDYFADIDPDEYPFSMITHSDKINVYGYFNGDKLDGIIRVDEYFSSYELSFFFVNKACQRQGIGQYLLQSVLNRFKDKKLRLSVYTDNRPAIHIYRKYGFKIMNTATGVGYRPDAPYYLMQRDIH